MLWIMSVSPRPFFYQKYLLWLDFFLKIKEVSKDLSSIQVHWSFLKLCSSCWEPQWIWCVLLNHTVTFTAFKMAAPWRYPFFSRIIHYFWLNKCTPPPTNPERTQCWRGFFSQKTLPVMISPEAAEKGFHQREQESMHFKYSAKNFWGDRWRGQAQLH